MEPPPTTTGSGEPCRGCALAHSEEVCPRCGRPRNLDPHYLGRIHDLAEEVVAAALDEDTFNVYGDGPKTALQASITQLARQIKHWHYEGDGCLDD